MTQARVGFTGDVGGKKANLMFAEDPLLGLPCCFRVPSALVSASPSPFSAWTLRDGLHRSLIFAMQRVFSQTKWGLCHDQKRPPNSHSQPRYGRGRLPIKSANALPIDLSRDDNNAPAEAEPLVPRQATRGQPKHQSQIHFCSQNPTGRSMDLGAFRAQLNSSLVVFVVR
jgi:hypothetical protein